MTPLRHVWPIWIAWLAAAAVVSALALAWRWFRSAALRAWRQLAAESGGEFRAKNSVSPKAASGSAKGRPFHIETATSHDDDTPYYHTRASMPVENPAELVLGLRRKSLLEEAQTRRSPSQASTGDQEFDRQFFVVCNDPDHLAQLLSNSVRRELSRYHDIELYAKRNEVEWRRAGEQSDRAAMRRLLESLAELADAIEGLPARRLSLSQRMADEALIEKGV